MVDAVEVREVVVRFEDDRVKVDGLEGLNVDVGLATLSFFVDGSKGDASVVVDAFC